MMPVANPVLWQVDVECMFHTGVQIELQSFAALLYHAELRVAFRHVRCALVHATEFTGLHVEADGQRLTREFYIVAAIHLYPFVVAAEVQRAFFHFCVAHKVDGRIVRRTVFKRSDMFGKARADKVPERTTHQSRMPTDGCPEFVHATAGIACYRQVFIHERRARIFLLWHHRRIHLQLIRRGIARTDDIFGRMGVGVAAIHKVACGIESFALFDDLCDQRSFAALIARTPEQDAGVVAVA